MKSPGYLRDQSALLSNNHSYVILNAVKNLSGGDSEIHLQTGRVRPDGTPSVASDRIDGWENDIHTTQSKRRYQAERWLQTAEEDQEAAALLLDTGMHAHACFHAQQSGVKAVKSLWYLIDAHPCGPSVQRLIVEFPQLKEIPDSEVWVGHGALLGQFYIPTRYPNGLPDLTPGQVYRREDAERGLEAARSLIAGCREWLGCH